MSKARLRKYLHKLARAANTAFAERALQQEHIRFMYQVNNEAKVRRTTKSLVLGKAKVMSYEDLEEARAKRASKQRDTATGRSKCDHEQSQMTAVEGPAIEVVQYRPPVARMV